MARIRRIVTGHDKKGRSVIASDEIVDSQPFPGMDGWNWLDLWGTDEIAQFPDDGSRPKMKDFTAPPGGVRYLIATIDPHTDERNARTTVDADKAMHRTATLDMVYVIEGSCMLEIGDSVQVQVNAGDTLVQCGTVHAWRNTFDQPCRLILAMVGARNELMK